MDKSQKIIETGRQTEGKREEIRYDHVARYVFVFLREKGQTILDLGCGTGYGAQLLGLNNEVMAIDSDREAINYAKEHYPGPDYQCGSIEDRLWEVRPREVTVCFELLEHLKHPETVSERMRKLTKKRAYFSVPNELAVPFDPKKHKYHYRHYTPREFDELLTQSGWTVILRGFQSIKDSPVFSAEDLTIKDQENLKPRTLIAVAEPNHARTRTT